MGPRYKIIAWKSGMKLSGDIHVRPSTVHKRSACVELVPSSSQNNIGYMIVEIKTVARTENIRHLICLGSSLDNTEIFVGTSRYRLSTNIAEVSNA
mmetsp:Transcript_1520/g.2183  ORF Transcript_1520/g.2183 Transcript_1520/m.2183 type:complete len:96 (-) Transcript_1520:134-421(-)